MTVWGVFFDTSLGIDCIQAYFTPLRGMSLGKIHPPTLYYGSFFKSECGKVEFEKDYEDYLGFNVPRGVTKTIQNVSLISDFEKYISSKIFKVLDDEIKIIEGARGVSDVIIPKIFSFMCGKSVVTFNSFGDDEEQQIVELYTFLQSSKHSFDETDTEEIIQMYIKSKITSIENKE